jgi:hypothetical protein
LQKPHVLLAARPFILPRLLARENISFGGFFAVPIEIAVSQIEQLPVDVLETDNILKGVFIVLSRAALPQFE